MVHFIWVLIVIVYSSCTVFNFGDGHAYYFERRVNGKEVGGLSPFIGKLMQVRKPNDLVLFGGDSFSGHPAFRVSGYEFIVDFMTYLQVDAFVLGNHEFDKGIAHLKKFLMLMKGKVPIISCNVFGLENIEPFIIVNRLDPYGNAIKVGILGVTTVEAITSDGVTVVDPYKVLPHYIDLLRHERKVDKLILLSHSGIEIDITFANLYDIDLVAGGHSHTLMSNDMNDLKNENCLKLPLIIHNTAISHAGCHYTGFSSVDLFTLKGKRYSITNNELFPKDEFIEQSLSQIKQKLAKNSVPLFHNTESLSWEQCKLGQAPLGTLICESMLYGFKKHVKQDNNILTIAMMNERGIRADLPAGPISKNSIYEILPFENHLSFTLITGKQLKTIINRVYSNRNAPSILQFSNNVAIELKNKEILNGRLKGYLNTVYVANKYCEYKELQDNQKIRLLSSSFVFRNGDSIFTPKSYSTSIYSLDELLIDYLVERYAPYPKNN